MEEERAAAWNGADGVGGRVRELRRSAGLSQAELAEGRCSKEYVSQIERGKARPTLDTLDWIAQRLATDREFLEHGVTRAETERFDAALADAEGLVEAHRHDEALRAFRVARGLAGAPGDPGRALRLLNGEAWARIRTGELGEAMTLLEQAAALSVTPGFTAVDRAEVVFRVGVVRYSESSITEAVLLFDEALVLAEREPASDRLRSDILHWRSRCHRRNRDWVAAGEDVASALELAESSSDSRRIADALFQASLVAQRQARWVLARSQAEQARALFARLGDRATVARLENNLAGLNHLLGNAGVAIELLDASFATFVDLDLPIDAGYVCSSLAEIRLEAGELELAEEQARNALDLLAGRIDHLQEVGTAELTLGRALGAQGRLDEADVCIARAEEAFAQASSVGHRSSAWIARGDLATERGNDRTAASLYRRAARALREEDALGA